MGESGATRVDAQVGTAEMNEKDGAWRAPLIPNVSHFSGSCAPRLRMLYWLCPVLKREKPSSPKRTSPSVHQTRHVFCALPRFGRSKTSPCESANPRGTWRAFER